MNKFAIALAAVVSLGLAIPAFAERQDGKARYDGRPSPSLPPSLSSHDGQTGTEAAITFGPNRFEQRGAGCDARPAPFNTTAVRVGKFQSGRA